MAKRLDNEFSWSYSRHSTFNECKKKYWYTYYGSWEGWPKTPYDGRTFIDPLASYLYTLKHIQHIPMYVGSVVHKTIEHYIKANLNERKLIEERELLEDGKKMFLAGLDAAKNEKWRESPKKYPNLFEYYYKTKTIQIDKSLEKVSACLENWIRSPIYKMLFSERSEWLSCEELDSFKLKNKYKIFVVIDFAMLWKKNDCNVLILFDWKTGELTEKTDEQLLSYALYIRETKPEFYGKIILSPFYLYKNHYTKIGFQQENEISTEMLSQIENKIESSCKAMLELAPERVTAGKSPPDPRLFAYTTERKSCEGCQYKELCTKANYQDLSHEELKGLVKEKITSLSS